jgi:hypothetical protein
MIQKMMKLGLVALLIVAVLFALLPAQPGYAGVINDEEPVGSSVQSSANLSAATTVHVASSGKHGTYLYPVTGDGYVLVPGWAWKLWLFYPKDTCFRQPNDSPLGIKWATNDGQPCIP